MSTAIFGVRMRDPNKMEWPRAVGELELGVLTWDVQDRLKKEISWCWCVTCTEYGSRLSPINTPWIYQLKELLVSHSPDLLFINDLGCQTSHNLIYLKSHYDNCSGQWILYEKETWTHIQGRVSHGLKSLRLGDIIWWQRSGLTLAQIMAYCLMAPNYMYYQNWCCLIVCQWCSLAFTWGQFHKRYFSHQPKRLVWRLLISNFIQISQGSMTSLIVSYIYASVNRVSIC